MMQATGQTCAEFVEILLTLQTWAKFIEIFANTFEAQGKMAKRTYLLP